MNRAFIGFDESIRICDIVESYIMGYYHLNQEFVQFGDYDVLFNLSNNNTYDDDEFERSAKSLLERIRLRFRHKPYVVTFHFCDKKLFVDEDNNIRNDWHCNLRINKIDIGR